jgi:bifunctional non-homologous end joining protein LigD
MLWQTQPKPPGGIRLPSGFIVPCQPVLARQVPIGSEWMHELTYDGYRLIARKTGDRLELWTEAGIEVTGQFSAIANALRTIPRDFVIDGEAVCEQPAGGRFYDLRSVAGRACCHLIAFDLLCLDGQDMCTTACETRRERLKAILPGRASLPGQEGVRFSESVDGPDGQVLFEHVCKRNLEGVVSKRKSSRYRSGPFDAWRKIECKDYRRD